MQRNAFRNVIDLIIVVVMLLGWIFMLLSLKYGFYIFGISTLALVFISKKRVINERILMGIIIFGMFSLCQPFAIALYRCGFQTLLAATLGFIIISHMKMESPSREH